MEHTNYEFTQVSKQIHGLRYLDQEGVVIQCIEKGTQPDITSSLCPLIGQFTNLMILDANWPRLIIQEGQGLAHVCADVSLQT